MAANQVIYLVMADTRTESLKAHDSRAVYLTLYDNRDSDLRS